MKNRLYLAVLAIFVFALTLPAFSAVSVASTVSEKLDLVIVRGKETTKVALTKGPIIKVGADGKTKLVLKSTGDKTLAEGTFGSGDYILIKKEGSSYKLTKVSKSQMVEIISPPKTNSDNKANIGNESKPKSGKNSSKGKSKSKGK